MAFLFPFRARFFKHSRDTAVNEESRLPPFFFLSCCFIDFLMLRSTWISSERTDAGRIRRDSSTTGYSSLGLFPRKLPIRHVNSDVCVYFDPIFSSPGQWSRNALMQIVAIAPDFPGRKRYKRASTLSHFLFATSLPVYPISPVSPPPLFGILPPALCICSPLSFKIDSPQGVARQA